MAEPWGKTGHRTEVAQFIQKDHLLHRKWMDNDRARELEDARKQIERNPGDPEVLAVFAGIEGGEQ